MYNLTSYVPTLKEDVCMEYRISQGPRLICAASQFCVRQYGDLILVSRSSRVPIHLGTCTVCNFFSRFDTSSINNSTGKIT